MRPAWLLLLLTAAASADTPVPELRDPNAPVEEKAPPATKTQLLRDVPAALTKAKRWVGRRYMTGVLPGKKTHETFTLQHDGKQALLTREVRVPTKWKAQHELTQQVLAWRTESITQLLGTVEIKGTVMTLAVANGSETIELACTRKALSAAKADAMRGRTPGVGGCEGDEGRWVPATRKKLDVFHCTSDPHEWQQLAFAASPGIEWVHVNDDCVIQGGGWRQVPANGSIKHPREKDPVAKPTKPS